MRTQTFGWLTQVKGSSHVTTVDRDVVVNFTSTDHLSNAAIVHMTPEQARKLAQQLIVYAEKVDPDHR